MDFSIKIHTVLFFCYFTDFGLWCVSALAADHYIQRLLLVFIGIVILALRVCVSVIANVIINSGEAFVKAVSDTIHKEFGNVKIAFDLSCVVAAVLLFLFFFDFSVVGTREGTVLSAVFTGVVVKFFTKRLKKPLEYLVAK